MIKIHFISFSQMHLFCNQETSGSHLQHHHYYFSDLIFARSSRLGEIHMSARRGPGLAERWLRSVDALHIEVSIVASRRPQQKSTGLVNKVYVIKKGSIIFIAFISRDKEICNIFQGGFHQEHLK